jgi:hypothetical protein
MFHLHNALLYYLYPLPVDMRKSFYTPFGLGSAPLPPPKGDSVMFNVSCYNIDIDYIFLRCRKAF